MNNEIKEILDELESLFELSEAPEHIINGFNKAKDYITNLQTIEQQYSVILSENAELENKITNLQKENEILKNGYCDLKVKCNNGECDCTNEEYEGMVQANMKGSLLLEDYKSRNKKAIEKLESIRAFGLRSGKTLFSTLINESIDILQGENKYE